MYGASGGTLFYGQDPVAGAAAGRGSPAGDRGGGRP